jgi:hypothetical protein
VTAPDYFDLVDKSARMVRSDSFRWFQIDSQIIEAGTCIGMHNGGCPDLPFQVLNDGCPGFSLILAEGICRMETLFPFVQAIATPKTARRIDLFSCDISPVNRLSLYSNKFSDFTAP